MSGLSHDAVEQVHHIARQALLGLAARGVAAAEFAASPEVQEVRITVRRWDGDELPVDLEFVGTHPVPLAGMSL